MKVWTLNELFRLTRVELLGLHREVVTELANTAPETPEREIALGNLRRIAKVLSLPNVAPA